ncbi:MAG: sugar phosphate isomerase/epimerase family protein [Bacteroidota bacterium]
MEQRQKRTSTWIATAMAGLFLLNTCSGSEPTEPAGEAVSGSPSSAEPVPAMNFEENRYSGDFVVGTQAFTFSRFSALEAIEKSAAAGARVIELYPGQPLAPEGEDEVGPEMSEEALERLTSALEEHDLQPVNFGVVRFQGEDQTRAVFEFARELELEAVTTELLTREDVEAVTPFVEEFDIRVAIHNHPKNPEDESYRIWDPEYVASMLEGADPRIGVSADTGHWIRSDLNPVEALQTLEGRLVSLHLKDVNARNRDGEDVIYGTGLSDIPAILSELERQSFGGHISIEYESNWLESVPDVAHNIGFIRGWSQRKNSP